MRLRHVTLVALTLAAASPALAQVTTTNPASPTAANPPARVVEHDNDRGNWGWLGLLGLAGLAGLMPRKDRMTDRTTLNDTTGTIRR